MRPAPRSSALSRPTAASKTHRIEGGHHALPSASGNVNDLQATADPQASAFLGLLASARRDVVSSSWPWVWAKASRSLQHQASMVAWLYVARSLEAMDDTQAAIDSLNEALKLDALRPEVWAYYLKLRQQAKASDRDICAAERALAVATNAASQGVDFAANRKGENLETEILQASNRKAVSQKLSKTQSQGNRSNSATIVDIIIPIFDGFDQTVACIESVLAHTPPEGGHLILVDDASPDPQIKAWLAGLAARSKASLPITVLAHDANAGFIGAVNTGLALHPGRDVVLLNADTVVFSEWLERLQRAAHSAPDIGTVAPLSNNAEQLSYPLTDDPQPVPPAALAAQIDRFLKKQNHPPITVPMGVGFCLYIRSDCRNVLGPLSMDGLVRGYGEDSDYCLRAVAKGFRNVCAPNVFVAHHGEVSFGPEKHALAQINLKTLYQRYPSQSAINQQFVKDDPLQPVRAAIDRKRFITPPNPSKAQRWLMVLGSTALSTAQERLYHHACQQRGKELWFISLELRKQGCTMRLRRADAIEPHHLRYDPASDSRQLAHDLKRLCFAQTVVTSQSHHQAASLLSLVLETVNCPVSHYLDALDDSAVSSPWFEDASILLCARPDIAAWLPLVHPKRQIQQAPWFAQLRAPNTSATNMTPGTRAVFVHPGDLVAYQALLQYSRHLARNESTEQLMVLGSTIGDQALMRTGKAWVSGELSDDQLARYLKLFRCSDSVVLEHRLDADQLAYRQSLRTGLPSTWITRKITPGASSTANPNAWISDAVAQMQPEAVCA
jgi:GT2 family glycosyltransferase